MNREDIQKYNEYLNYFYELLEEEKNKAVKKILALDVCLAFVWMACETSILHCEESDKKEYLKSMVDLFFEKSNIVKKNNNTTQKEKENDK